MKYQDNREWPRALPLKAMECAFFGIGITPGEYFDGFLDDVRIYNRALSADEIKRLYNIGGTVKLNTSQNLNNNNSLQKGLVGWWTLDGKDLAGNMGITSARTAYDRSGNGNHGKYWNATSTPPVVGKIGQGLEFDGVDDYVDIPSSAPLQFSGSFSSSFWIKTTGLNTTDQSLLISNDIFATTGWYTAPH